MSNDYMKSDDRKVSILKAALALTRDEHYRSLTRDQIAIAGKTSTGNVTRIFGEMHSFRRELVLYAIHTKHYRVMIQALCVNDKTARENLTHDEKSEVLDNAMAVL